MHILAIVSLVLVEIPVWVKAVAIVATLVIGVKVVTQYLLLKARNSIVKINASGTGKQCQVETQNGITYHAWLKRTSWLFGYFALLVFDADTRIFKAIIAKDAVNQEQFHTLRLYLRSLDAPQSDKTGFTRP